MYNREYLINFYSYIILKYFLISSTYINILNFIINLIFKLIFKSIIISLINLLILFSRSLNLYNFDTLIKYRNKDKARE